MSTADEWRTTLAAEPAKHVQHIQEDMRLVSDDSWTANDQSWLPWSPGAGTSSPTRECPIGHVARASEFTVQEEMTIDIARILLEHTELSCLSHCDGRPV